MRYTARYATSGDIHFTDQAVSTWVGQEVPVIVQEGTIPGTIVRAWTEDGDVLIEIEFDA
jgi:hypothetical protein